MKAIQANGDGAPWNVSGAAPDPSRRAGRRTGASVRGRTALSIDLLPELNGLQIETWGKESA